jgi:HNH endonuclease
VADGRTYWYSEDASYVHRGRIVALGEELGMAVLAVMQVLKGIAARQSDTGRLSSDVITVAEAAFVRDFALAQKVIVRAHEYGVLTDLEWGKKGCFRCRIADWRQHRPARRRRPPIPRHTREEVLARDGYVCGLCGAPVTPEAFHFDHILPWSQGGSHAAENLQVAHPDCNRRKGNRIRHAPY